MMAGAGFPIPVHCVASYQYLLLLIMRCYPFDYVIIQYSIVLCIQPLLHFTLLPLPPPLAQAIGLSAVVVGLLSAAGHVEKHHMYRHCIFQVGGEGGAGERRVGEISTSFSENI